MVTHDPRVASGADRVVEMRDGRITSAGALSASPAPVGTA
jgi:ABC-type lipoprotein export system ATPase subunit